MVCVLKMWGPFSSSVKERQEGIRGSEKGLHLLAYSSPKHPDLSLEADWLSREGFFIQII